MIQAVTFDFWNTLYVEGPADQQRRRLRAEYAEGFLMGLGAGVAAKQMEYAFEILAHDQDHFRLVNHVAFSAEENGRRLARIVGVELAPSDAARLGELISSAGREEPPVPAAGAREILSALHGRVRLGLICDTGTTLGHDLYAVMEADGLARLFDHFTFSNQTGTTKPEARQFHHTLYRLGCRPEEAVHVGDLEPTDIAGAQAVGMRTIRILHEEDEPATAADATVDGIGQVLGVLRGWGATL